MSAKKEQLLTSDLIRGNSTTLVLTILAGASAPGFVITELIRTRSNHLIGFKEGSIYPLLHDLQNQGLVTSEWEILPGERPKRVYSLTPLGLQELERRTAAWREFSQGMNLVLGGGHGDSNV